MHSNFVLPTHFDASFCLSHTLHDQRFLQVDDTEVVNFLLQTEIIPLCLRIMETGSELSKTVATFIVQKMLLDEMGLTYVCATAERFYAVSILIGLGAPTLLETQILKRLAPIQVKHLLLSSSVFIYTMIFCFMIQVSTVLSGMVSKLLENPSVRLLKHIVRCYLRLSEHPR